jgi:hypothetical protein
LLLLFTAACQQAPAGDLHRTARQFAVPSATPPIITPQAEVPTLEASALATAVPATVPVTLATATPAVASSATSPTVVATPAGGGANTFLSPELTAATRLAAALPVVRDDLLLAQTYQGLTISNPATLKTFSVGDTDTLTILNYRDNSTTQMAAELSAMSDHAYFWFETGTGSVDPAALTAAATAFDDIYAAVTTQFGTINDPGIDGDLRLHIVHAGRDALCGAEGGCGLAGYYSADNALPRAVNPNSNERDMFVMNATQFGTGGYLSVLAHELRHLIEAQYSVREADWAVEGSAVLAEELAGWPQGAYATGNGYLADPDLQLNHWSITGNGRHYGQGYVFSRYLYAQLGPAGYRALATHPGGGLRALDELQAAGIIDRTGEQLWQDWLVAMAIHNRPDASDRYDLGDVQMANATMTNVNTLPATWQTSVSQYGVDYYRLPAGEPVQISFTGSPDVPTLDTTPPSGAHMWVAGRSNFSESRLTRAFDLREVDSATLTYSVYTDIEAGFDFAYLFVSTDGGANWTPLVAPGMQDRNADPGRVALADHFYTGRSAGWLQESVDLTPYAGEEILVRFSYVTDPVLTDQGLVLDDLAVPEIGFFDDVENGDNGWLAEGFVPVTATLTQQWHLQLVVLGDGPPQIVVLPLAADASLTYSVPQTAEGAILIVGAAAPYTLQPAGYELALQP